MSLAEVIELPEPEPTTKECGSCYEVLSVRRFKKSELDDPEARCASCRAPRRIDDPDTPLARVMASSLAFPLPDDWAAKMSSGANFKVEVTLHIDNAVGDDNAPRHWAARWLEVTRISD